MLKTSLYHNVKSESWSSPWQSWPSGTSWSSTWPSWARWRPDQGEGEGVAGEENRGCEGHCSGLRGELRSWRWCWWQWSWWYWWIIRWSWRLWWCSWRWWWWQRWWWWRNLLVRKSKYVFSLINSVCSEIEFPSEWSMTPCKVDTYNTYNTLSCSEKTNLLFCYWSHRDAKRQFLEYKAMLICKI